MNHPLSLEKLPVRRAKRQSNVFYRATYWTQIHLINYCYYAKNPILQCKPDTPQNYNEAALLAVRLIKWRVADLITSFTQLTDDQLTRKVSPRPRLGGNECAYDSIIIMHGINFLLDRWREYQFLLRHVEIHEGYAVFLKENLTFSERQYS